MTSGQVYLGISVTIALAVGGQILGQRLRIPALIILLPAGFAAGALTDDVNPSQLLGPSFQPLVSIAVAVILYDSGLGLDLSKLVGHTRTVVVRLLVVGVPLSWLVTCALAQPLFNMSFSAALMLGVILVVSGPTVVGPLLNFVRPSDRIRHVLSWEGSLIDPVGGLLGALVFHAIVAQQSIGHGRQILEFLISLLIGGIGAVVGIGLLWLLLTRMHLSEQLGTAAQLAVVMSVGGLCDMVREDTGLIAAIGMGVALANMAVFDMPARRPFFEVTVQLIIGLLFVSNSTTVTPSSVHHLLLPTLALVGGLVIVARPMASALSTLHTSLSRGERAFVGWMAPRGIVAAATASTFASALVQRGIPGAQRILPVTFLVIVATVTLYGLTAAPVARWLGVTRPTVSRPLIVGGEPWAIDLGCALRDAGLEVLMWAQSPGQRARIRSAGLTLAPDELIADASAEGVELEGVTAILLLTGEDEFNALAATLFTGVTRHTYRVGTLEDVSGSAPVYAGGEILFNVALTGAELALRHRNGSRIVLVSDDDPVSDGHDLLFRIRASGDLAPVVSGVAPERRAGDMNVLLGPMSAEQ